MAPIETLLLVLVAIVVLATIARRFGVPDPILLVLGGISIGLIPDLPPVELEPDFIFLVFLPPILYSAGYFSSIRDLRANLRPILLLAVGLVLFTMLVVATVVSALVPGMSWPVALALGAIVSPPDAVAATSVFRRLGVPRRIVTILEGESLVNDATALVAYRTAVGVAGGAAALSAAGLGVEFVFVAVGGFVVGLVFAMLGRVIWRLVDDPPIEITLTIIYPLVTYVLAERLGVSGVIATVVAGIYAGRNAARVLSSSTRVQGKAAWGLLLFLINGFVFLLIGLQLPIILGELGAERSATELVGLGIAVSLAAIAARILWVFPATYLPRWLSAKLRERDPYPAPRNVFVVSWAGMRGVVSLAAALALPSDFPQRALLIFLTFCVIFATLVVQGLTLPLLIRRLGVMADASEQEEEAHARTAAVEAALARLLDLEQEYADHLPLIEQLRTQYEHRSEHVTGDALESDEGLRDLVEHRAIRRAMIDAERDAVIGLRDVGAISDDVLRRVERDLDLEELRMEA